MGAFEDQLLANFAAMRNRVNSGWAEVDALEEERKRKKAELDAASQMTSAESSRRKQGKDLFSSFNETQNEWKRRAAAESLWENGETKKAAPEPGFVGKIKEAWQLGEGMDTYYEGWGERRANEGVGGDQKIQEGMAQMEAHKDASEYGHKWADMSQMGTVDKLKEYAKAALDPAGMAVDVTTSLPAMLDIAKYQMGAGVAANLAALASGGAGLVLHGAGVTAATHMEASDEANAVYEQIYNEQLEMGKSSQDAHRMAKDMADEAYYKNLAILGATNTIEQVSMFGGYASAAVKAAKKAGKTAKDASRITRTGAKVDEVANKIKGATGVTRAQEKLADMGRLGKGIEFVGRGFVTAGIEGAQEGLQYIASQTAMDKDWEFGTEFAQNVSAGVAMGGGMHVAGTALGVGARAAGGAIRSKLASQAEADKAPNPFPNLEDVNPEADERLQKQFVAGLPDEIRTQLSQEIESLIDGGMDAKAASRKALDNLINSDPGLAQQARQIATSEAINEARSALTDPKIFLQAVETLPAEEQAQYLDIVDGLMNGSLSTREQMEAAIDFAMENHGAAIGNAALDIVRQRNASAAPTTEEAPAEPPTPGEARYTPPEETGQEEAPAPPRTEAPKGPSMYGSEPSEAAPPVESEPVIPQAAPPVEDVPVVPETPPPVPQAPPSLETPPPAPELSIQEQRQAAIDQAPDLAAEGIVLHTGGRTANEKRLTALAQRMGLEIEFFNSKDDTVAEFVMPNEPGVIYIRRGGGHSGRSEIWALGHGFVHALKKQHPELYAQLASAVANSLTDEQKRSYLKLLDPEVEVTNLSEAQEEAILEEILADEGGNFFLKMETWEAIYKTDPTLFEKLVAFMREFLDSLRGDAKRVENRLNGAQIKKFRAEFEKVVAEVAKAQEEAHTEALVNRYNELIEEEIKYVQSLNFGTVSFMPDEYGLVQRSSVNQAWYRKFWDDHGRAPRKGEWREIAIANLVRGNEEVDTPQSQEFLNILSELSRGKRLSPEWKALQESIRALEGDPALADLVQEMKAEQERVEPGGSNRDLGRLNEVERRFRRRMTDQPDFEQYNDVAFSKRGSYNDIYGNVRKSLYQIGKDNGGFTYDVLRDALVDKGVAVSPYSQYEAIVPEAEFTAEVLEQYMVDHAEVLAQADHKFGMWFNEEDGNIYLDISIVKETRDEAIKLGLEHNQLAAFDLERMEEVHVQTAEERAAREKLGRDANGNQGEQEGAGPATLPEGDGSQVKFSKHKERGRKVNGSPVESRQSKNRAEPSGAASQLDSRGRQEIWDFEGSNGRNGNRPGPQADRQVSGRRNVGRRPQAILRDHVVAALKDSSKIDITPIKDVGDPGVFYFAFKKAREGMERKGYVDLHSIAEYKEMRLFLTLDNASGVAVEKNGNIVSLFNASKSPRIRGAGVQLMLRALSAGGNRCDNYHGGLSMIYEQLGFVPIARVEFDAEIVKEFNPDWNTKDHGTPDIIFFAHNGDDPATVAKKYGTYELHDYGKLPKMSYGEAQKMRDEYLEEREVNFSRRKATVAKKNKAEIFRKHGLALHLHQLRQQFPEIATQPAKRGERNDYVFNRGTEILQEMSRQNPNFGYKVASDEERQEWYDKWAIPVVPEKEHDKPQKGVVEGPPLFSRRTKATEEKLIREVAEVIEVPMQPVTNWQKYMARPDIMAADLLSRLLTGREVILFHADPQEELSGVHYDGNVFIDPELNKYPIIYVVKHELIHALDITDPKAYAKLEALTQEHLKTRGNRYAVEAYYTIDRTYSQDEVKGEFTADVMAQLMEDSSFWAMVKKKEPGLLNKLVGILDDIIQKFRGAIDQNNDMLQYLDDLEDFKAKAAGIVRETLATRKVEPKVAESAQALTGVKFSKRNVPVGDKGQLSRGNPATVLIGDYDNEHKKNILAEVIEDGRGVYDPIKLNQLVEDAADLIGKRGLVGARKFCTDDKMQVKDVALAVAVALQLVDHFVAEARNYERQGDYVRAEEAWRNAADINFDVSEVMTQAGQGAAAGLLWTRQSGGSLLASAKRKTEKIYSQLPTKVREEFERTVQDAHDATQDINAEAIQGILFSDEVTNAIKEVVKRERDLRGEQKESTQKKKAKTRQTPPEILAAMVRRYVAEPQVQAQEEDPIRVMLKTLMEVVKETMPKEKQPKPEQSPIDVLRMAMMSREEYRRTWEMAKNIFRDKYGLEFDQIEDFLAHYLSTPFAKNQMDLAVAKTAKELNINLLDAVAGGTIDQVKEQIVTALDNVPYLGPQRGGQLNQKVAESIDRLLEQAREEAGNRLAKQVLKMAEEGGTNQSTPSSDMMGTLLKIVRKTMKEQGKAEPRNPMEVIVAAIKNREAYRDIWLRAHAELFDKHENDPALATLDKFFLYNTYPGYVQEQVDSAINRGVKDLEINISELIKEHYTRVDATSRTLVSKLMENTGLDPAHAVILESTLRAALDKKTSAAKTKALEALVKRNVSKRDRKSFMQKLIELSNMGAFGVEAYRTAVAKEYGIPVIDDEAGAAIMRLADVIQTSTGATREDAVAELNAFMADLQRADKLRKISTIQTMAMLLNPKTNIRNIGGNEMMYRADRISKYVATPIDVVRSVLTGTERTVTFRTGGQTGYWEGFARGWKYGLRGWIVADVASQYDLHAGLSFKWRDDPAKDFRDFMSKWFGNFNNMGERTLRATLQGFDQAAYNRAYNQTLGEIACLACINKKLPLTQANIDKEMETLDLAAYQAARDYGKYLTFQDDNAITTALVATKRGLNVGGKLGWGPGDWLLKFPRTAGGLMMRGIEYSPLGFLRVAKYAYLAFGPEPNAANQRELSMALSRSLVGSFGITALGLNMAAAGLIFGAGEDDKDFGAFVRSQGMKTTMFNATGLRRWIFSGFNKEEAQPRQGDLFISYDWAQPLSMSIAMGVGMNRATEISKTDAAQGVLIGMAAAINSIVEQPLLRGIQNLVAPSYGGDKVTHSLRAAGSVLTGIPASFIPSMLNLVRQDVDNVRRYTRSTGGITVPELRQETLNQIKNRVPWVSKSLPATVSGFGDIEKLQGSEPTGLKKMFHVYLNPSYVNRYNPSPEAQQALDIYRETKSTKHFPNQVEVKITANGKTFVLPPEDRMALQRQLGSLVKVGYNALDPTWSKDKQAKEMVDFMGEAWDAVKMDYLTKQRTQELVESLVAKEVQKAKESK